MANLFQIDKNMGLQLISDPEILGPAPDAKIL